MPLKTDQPTVPASEFTRNFGHYRVKAQRGPVAVSSHGRIAGYFIAPEEYEDYERVRSQRRSFATEDLDDAKVEAVRQSRMAPRHADLDKLLDD
jgi:PHD/YefM family antitoxin component YafN of YafNO toxin-antitoxin module